ncbi:MAG: hypothetical protein EBR23_09820 [Planctomycetia bacterium]|nr:hypothetical protein [Planctomycetia bacterium]
MNRASPEPAPAILPISSVLPLLATRSVLPFLAITFWSMPISTCVPLPPLGSTRIRLLPALVTTPGAVSGGGLTLRFWLVIPEDLPLMSSVPPPDGMLEPPPDPRVSVFTPLTRLVFGTPAPV